jgi:hypothetical protein
MTRVIAKGVTALLLTLSLSSAVQQAFANDRLNVTVVQKDNTQVIKQQVKDMSVFGWSPERKLTWSDFKGNTLTGVTDETAASICHGFGIQTDTAASNGQHIVVNVFNVFYPTKSWVRDGEQSSAVLAHEQTHFDICELYTRILKERLAQAYLTRNNFNAAIKQIYTQVQAEYVAVQELYEEQTNHGLIAVEQQRWQNDIQMQLSDSHYALR